MLKQKDQFEFKSSCSSFFAKEPDEASKAVRCRKLVNCCIWPLVLETINKTSNNNFRWIDLLPLIFSYTTHVAYTKMGMSLKVIVYVFILLLIKFAFVFFLISLNLYLFSISISSQSCAFIQSSLLIIIEIITRTIIICMTKLTIYLITIEQHFYWNYYNLTNYQN